MNKEALFLIALWISAFVLGMTVGNIAEDNNYIQSKTTLGERNHMKIGCDGIGHIYENDTLLSRYFLCDDFSCKAYYIAYIANHTGNFTLRTPEELLEGKPLNCQSISNAVYCLSSLYPEIECEFYVTVTFNMVDEESGHIGIKCRGEEIGNEWKEFY